MFPILFEKIMRIFVLLGGKDLNGIVNLREIEQAFDVSLLTA